MIALRMLRDDSQANVFSAVPIFACVGIWFGLTVQVVEGYRANTGSERTCASVLQTAEASRLVLRRPALARTGPHALQLLWKLPLCIRDHPAIVPKYTTFNNNGKFLCKIFKWKICSIQQVGFSVCTEKLFNLRTGNETQTVFSLVFIGLFHYICNTFLKCTYIHFEFALVILNALV